MITSPAMLAGLICVFISAVDLTVIAAIMPGMIGDLAVNTADFDRYIWIVNAYLISYVVAIPIMGRLSDHIGRQRAFLICLIVFGLGSIVAATADTMSMAVVGRVIQGIGGGGLLPVTVALAGDVLPTRMRLAGVGLVSAAETLGWVLGPTWGAFVTAITPAGHDAWRWVFWSNVPIAALAVLAIFRGFPHADRGDRRPISQIDLLGTLLLAILLVCSNLLLSSGGDHGAGTNTGLRAFGGTPNPVGQYVWPLVAGTVISLVLLVLWERRVTHPIFPVDLLRTRYFVAAVVANFLVGAALMVAMVNVPVIVSLAGEPGHASRDSALLLVPLTLSIAIVSSMTGWISGRMGEWRMTTLGVLLAAAGLGSVYFLVDMNHLWHMAIGLAIAGIGIGLLLAPLGATALDASDTTNRGTATSTALLFRLLGMTIGMSVLTTAGIWRLQQLTGRLDPVVQEAGESTAAYFLRQQDFVNQVVTPIGVQVMQETFLAAAILIALAMIPVRRMRHAMPAN